MNTHPTYEQLQEYLDGALPTDSDTALHIASCELCRSELELYRSIDTGVRETPLPAVSDHLSARVMAALNPAAADRYSYREERSLAPVVVLLLSGAVMVIVALSGAGSADGGSLIVDALQRAGVWFSDVVRPLGGTGLGTLFSRHIPTDLSWLKILAFSLLVILAFSSIERMLSHRGQAGRP